MPESVSSGPSIPSEATSEGGINESLPVNQREPSRVPDDLRKLNKGPKRGENGEFQPAVYKTNTEHDIIRTDR